MAEIGFKLDMPIQKSDEEQPFAFGLRLGDFTMPDTLWGLFDPAAILPRDPATIFVDVTGKAKVLFDMMDPEAAETFEDEAPGELNALTINELLISAVGAKLSGTGDFTFDNSDTQSFDGIPAPSGSASLQLAGANALLDRLIQMGIMSDSDAMGARMMMGMLAVPGDAPDTLKSDIEINDQGHITANGQRIK
jgi:PPE-repeat protein